MESLIFHVDVNSAYLSWESARRVKKPVCLPAKSRNFLSKNKTVFLLW